MSIDYSEIFHYMLRTNNYHLDFKKIHWKNDLVEYDYEFLFPKNNGHVNYRVCAFIPIPMIREEIRKSMPIISIYQYLQVKEI
jgi:hypothetical protein